MMVVGIFGFVGRYWSQNTPMTLFFPHPSPIITMECLLYILAGNFKAGVQSIKLDDSKVDTELTRKNMQKCMTWTKKIQKGAWDLRDEQIHCRIKEKRLLTPV